MRSYALALMLALFSATASAQWHSIDTDQNGSIGLAELLRLVQFYNAGALHCSTGTEDGFAPGPGDTTCPPHNADYFPQDWTISLSELLRGVQLFNSEQYHACPGVEDNYCAGAPAEGEGTQEGAAEGEVAVEPIEMVYVPAGTFEMGRPYTGTGSSDELPVHEVYLDAYAIGKYEVTNQQMADVLNWAYDQGYLKNSSGGAYRGGLVYAHGQRLVDTYASSTSSSIEFSGGSFTVQSRAGIGGNYDMADHPVVRISWYSSVAYCNWRSEMEGLDPVYDTSNWTKYSPVRNGYRLPTEAEWERAAAWDGSKHWRYGFTSDTISTAQANYEATDHANPLGLTTLPYTSPVGWFDGVNISPNGNVQTLNSQSPVGAYDMSGNMSEWCGDWYASGYYATSPGSNPEGPATGTHRVLRGGGWSSTVSYMPAAVRNFVTPLASYSLIYFGLRVSRTVDGTLEGDSEGTNEGNTEGEGEGTQEGAAEGEVDPIEMVYIPAGTFEMGRPYTNAGSSDELPVHEVYLDAYAIGKYEVTNQQMADVLNWAFNQGYLDNSSGGAYTGGLVYAHGQRLVDTYASATSSSIEFSGGSFTVQSRTGIGGSYSMADHPVVQVSWYGAVAYCNWRSEMEGLEPAYNTSNWSKYSPVRNGYRLPTEAEWERAAAWDGSQHWRYGFTSDAISTAQANYYATDYANPLGLTERPYTSPVGWFNGVNESQNGNVQTLNSPSPAGAYDMIGNVWEWCGDWYASGYYRISSDYNPEGPATGASRVLRGGGWSSSDNGTRAAIRLNSAPGNSYSNNGLRVSRTP